MILADVEFLQDGHAEQQREHAAEPQQQAIPAKENIPPILCIWWMDTLISGVFLLGYVLK